MAALALEVVWMRILVQVFCATVYAFAIMLSCFLFGIFYGSKWISKRVDQQTSLPRLIRPAGTGPGSLGSFAGNSYLFCAGPVCPGTFSLDRC